MQPSLVNDVPFETATVNNKLASVTIQATTTEPRDDDSRILFYKGSVVFLKKITCFERSVLSDV